MRFEELSHMMQKPEPKPDTYEAGMAQNQLLEDWHTRNQDYTT